MHTHTHTQIQHFLTVVALAGCCAGASAQIQPIVVSGPYRVSPDDEHWHECSIGVNQGPDPADRKDLLVMAAGPGLLRYVAFDWDPAQIAPDAQSVQGCNGGDVWVTPHPGDGSVWFTALQGGGCIGEDCGGGEDGGSGWPTEGDCGGLIYGWKDAGADSLTGVEKLSGESLQDKPSLTIWNDDQAQTHWYLIRMRKIGNCNKNQFDIDISTDATANDWENYTVAPTGTYSGCHYEGWGAISVILDTGRIVTVSRDENPESGGQYYYNIPYVIYSDHGDPDVWFPGPDPNQEIQPVRLGYKDEDELVYASTTKGPVNDPGDTPWNVDRRNHAPGIAVERIPGDHDRVYVAFCARSAQNSTNTDIYITRSVDAEGTISFPGPGDLRFLQITDAMLGLTGAQAEADQFVPAIALDSCGGINLMFYDNRNDPDGFDGDPGVQEDWVDVYYARITGFGTPSPVVQQWRLTPNPIRTDNMGQGASPGFLGDYHNFAVAGNGRVLYAAYIARETSDPENGTVSCYAHRINLNCAGPLSDFNGDGEVTTADADGYVGAWLASDPNADNDLDAAVDGDDLVDYITTYSQEGGQ